MCDQIPDELILNGQKVSIEPLLVLESEVITSVPEKGMSITTGHMLRIGN